MNILYNYTYMFVKWNIVVNVMLHFFSFGCNIMNKKIALYEMSCEAFSLHSPRFC